MSDQLELNCLVYGDKPNHIFSVKISGTKNVGTLKEAIKEKKRPLFDTVPADHLVLWKVLVPVDRNLQASLSELNLVEEKPLRPVERLSKTFPITPIDGHLHIVIKRPLAVLPLYSQQQPLLELNCLVYGDEPSDVFTIKIARTESVYTVKKAIKEKKQHSFQHLDAPSLQLWKVSVPVDKNLQANLAELNLLEKEPLLPVGKLSAIFPDLPVKRNLHIVVQCPESLQVYGTLPTLSPSISKKRAEYFKRYPSKPPSSQVELAYITKTQQDTVIAFACGRPFEEATPATLLDETLAAFRRNLEMVIPSPRDCECFYALRSSMCQIFPSVDERRAELSHILTEHGVLPRYPDLHYVGGKNWTDGSLLSHQLSKDVLFYIQEVKNESTCQWTDTKSEPFFEAILYYLEYVRQNNTDGPNYHKDHVNFPAIIVLEFGPYLGLVAATFTSRPVVEFLTCIPLFVHSSNRTQLEAGERAIAALRIAVNALQSRYDAGIFTEFRPRADFPFRTSFVADGKSHIFSYITAVDGRRVFRARLEDRTPIIVKFTQRYNEAAHRAAEAIGLAPKLYAVQDVYGWYMVVMADCSETFSTLYDLKPSAAQRTILQKVKDSLIQRLSKLHSAGYVHGDVRDVNVLVDKAIRSGREGETLLVDWDWAGEEGKVLYPNSISPVIVRPKEAVAGSPILASQDIAMAELLRFSGFVPMEEYV